MIISADTNLFLYAANPSSPNHQKARQFFETYASGEDRFLVCGLVPVEPAHLKDLTETCRY